MTKFESGVKVVPASQEAVYEKLSDLSNLEKVKDRLPEDKVKNLSFDAESMTIEVAPVGKITLQIVEKEPCKCIKFATTTSPLPFNLWIQIVPVTETECKNETDHRHGYKSVYEDHGAETLAGRIGEDGRYVAMIQY